jgi:hypothetical protein
MSPNKPVATPFTLPARREAVTGEGDGFVKGHVSWDGYAQHGGGHVPDDYEWPSNPKEHQDELMGEWPREH